MSESTADGQPAVRDGLTGFQRDLLFAIAHCDGWPDAPRTYRPSGADIMDELNGAYDEEVKYGRLYSNLRELADESRLAEQGYQDGRTKAYRLTEAGVAVCERHIEWMVNGLEGER